MPVDYAKVQEIFLNVLNKPAGQNRVAFIDEACGADVELRDFIRGMLAHHEKNATPIPQGPTKLDDRTQGYSEPALVAGSIIGDRYKIIELIAEGGMGSVYRACRISDMKMEVAIKVIKPGMDSQQVLARFNIEKQALAIMKHDNIARVLDAGMTDKRLPYFVMELVKGLSLTKFCDDSKLTIEQRLELFEQICSAVQHAHQKGIVHRDLKPSNILVALYDDKPVPKVIDFGLAKALYQPLTDDDIRTRFGMFVGTWQYTAPEQAKLNSLDIDTRADIYSLGVILYELLTGTTPLEKQRLVRAAYDELMQIIQNEEPQKPSTKIHSSNELTSIAALRHTEPIKLEKQIRGELDWIVIKALDKDRNRRYASANEFAADIRRYLLDEPVQAGPPSFSYKASKFLRKHKGKVLVAGLLIATAVVGAVVSTIGWNKAVQETHRANTQTEIAVAINDFLRELLSEADPSVQIRPDQQFVSNITVKKALDRAAEKVGSKFTDKPLIEAAIRHTMGKTYMGLGDLPSARIQFDKAEQLRKKYGGEDNPDRLETLYELGWLDMEDTKFLQAEMRLKEVLERRENRLGPKNAATLKGKYAMGLLLSQTDKLPQAKKLLEEVLAEQQRILGEDSEDTLRTQSEIANLLIAEKKVHEANQLYREIHYLRKLKQGKEHPLTLIAQNNLARGIEQYPDAKEELKMAEEMFRELVEAGERTLGSENPTTLSFKCNLASNYILQNRFQEGINQYQKLIPVMRRVIGSTAYDCIAAIQNCAAGMAMNKQYKESELLLLEAWENCKKTLGSDHEKTHFILQNIIDLYRAWGKPDKVNEFEKKLPEKAK